MILPFCERATDIPALESSPSAVPSLPIPKDVITPHSLARIDGSSDKYKYPVRQLLIQVLINSEELVALVDTGATISLLENKYVSVPIFPTENCICVVVVGGRKIKLDDVCHQYFTIADKYGHLYTHTYEFFPITNLGLRGVNMILGLNAILALNLNILTNHNVLKLCFRNTEIPLTFPDSCLAINVNAIPITNGVHLSYNVTLSTDLLISANSLLDITLEVPSLSDGPVLVYPVGEMDSFMRYESLSEVIHGTVKVFVFNFLNCPVFIELGTVICRVEPVELFHIASLELSNSDERLTSLIELAKAKTPVGLHSQISDVVCQYSDIFALESDPPGYCDWLPVTVDTGDASPVVSVPYKIPLHYQQEVSRQLREMLNTDIISYSKSAWRSPVVVVKKKNGKLRLCIDYRKLNRVTKADQFPIPCIEEIFCKLRDNVYFSTLDLKSGYHQVALAEDSKEKTAFAANDGLYEFNVLPFGLRNGPAHFSRLMQSVLTGMIGTICFVYLDDIIILGRSLEEHLENLSRVLTTLRSFNLRLSLEKFCFLQSEITYLGHIVSREGIRPMFDKVSCIKNYPRPINGKQIQSFLGLAGYYRRFIRDFSYISRPLDSLRNCSSFVWTQAHETAFIKLKEGITEHSILHYPDFNREFLLTADASDYAIGGVISQLDSLGRDRPISFASRSLSPAERNYHALEREALAVIFMLDRHRYFLLGHNIRVRSDHKPLKVLIKDDKLNPRQARWLDKLLEFQLIDFVHISGKKNVVADALSRIPYDNHVCVVTRAMARTESNADNRTDGNNITDSSVSGPVNDSINEDMNEMSVCDNTTCRYNVDVIWDLPTLIREQESDPVIGQVRAFLRHEIAKFPSGLGRDPQEFCLESDVLYVIDVKRGGYYYYRCVLPPSFVPQALILCHSCPLSGHLGIENTWRKASEYFYWRNMRGDIKRFVKSCHLCNLTKAHRIKVPPARIWPITSSKWERVHIDLIGPLPTSITGDRFIFVLCDAFTRFVFVKAMPDKSALSVAKSLYAFIGMFGAPRSIISDNGTEFVNLMFSELVKLLGISHTTILGYRPSSNGLVESKNKIIVSMLRYLAINDPTLWSSKLNIVSLALNTAYNRSIRDTPYFLVFGQDPYFPVECFSRPIRTHYNQEDYCTYIANLNKYIFETTKKFLSLAQSEYAREYDRRFHGRIQEIRIGHRVYIKRLQPRKNKLDSPMIGPFRVLDIKNNSIKVRHIVNGTIYTVHRCFVLVVPESLAKESDHANVRAIYPGKESIPNEDIPDYI